MTVIQNIQITESSAMIWFSLALIAGVIFLILKVGIKAIEAVTIKNLKKLRRNGYTQEFKGKLHKALRDSIESETNDDGPTISTYHKNLLRLYKDYLLDVYPSKPLDSMLVIKTAVSLKKRFVDLKNVKPGITFQQESAEIEQLRKDVLSELAHHLK